VANVTCPITSVYGTRGGILGHISTGGGGGSGVLEKYILACSFGTDVATPEGVAIPC
jgi:hypothetical protein